MVLNPAIGTLSDSWARRTGSRQLFLRVGAALLPVFFALTFAVPDGVDATVGAVWVGVAFIASAVAFSLFQVPYIAMPAELTDDYHERARLMAWRVAVLASRSCCSARADRSFGNSAAGDAGGTS